MFYSKSNPILRLHLSTRHFYSNIFFKWGEKYMKIKEHIIILLLIFLMLFVCIGSVSALKNQTDDYAENEIIGIGGSPDGGTFKELQDKITDAGENGTVDLANNYTYDDSFSKNGINITKAITINGNGFTINGLDKSRIFNIDASNHIVLNNITFINGKSDLGGAIIFNNPISNSVIDNCKFINNNVGTNGGALYAKSTFTNNNITNTEFINNTASKNGGSAYINNNANENLFENLTFANNKAKNNDGGAINFHNSLSKTTFKNITFFKNSAKTGGGAINTDQNINDNNSYINVKFINNTASKNGGAINGYGNSNYNSFDGCEFVNNSATSKGGAIYYTRNFNSNIFEYCSFINNTAKENGGVIYINMASNSNKFNKNSFIKNNATNNAGVIYYHSSSSSDIYNNTEFINNTALSVDGGCINAFSDLVNITFNNSTFINNKAGGNGGAINVDDDAKNNNFINTKFINNTASKNGGAISLVNAADNIWNNTIFIQNKAINISGGAIQVFIKIENNTIINSSFIANNAKTKGGAINIRYNSSYLKIIDSSFINNTANIGGAIYYTNTTNDNFLNVNFTNNKALNNSYGGGAIYVNDTAIKNKFDSLIFTNNTAMCGGALYISKLLKNTLVNIKFINNTANFNGGAVYIKNTFINNNFNNTKFINNNASRNGGAIYTIPSSIANKFENSIFENNYANEVDGGAINLHTDLLETTFNNVKFINNTAGYNGGAINIDHGSKDNIFNNTSFINNTATRNGGVIYTRWHSIHNTYKNTIFNNNSAINVDGGAINIFGNLLNNTFDNSTFINNSAKNGGAINVDDDAKNNVFINTKFIENTAKSNGGAFCVINTNNNTWNNTHFIGNTANNNGGAIHNYKQMQNEKIINSTFTDNLAGINGSALNIKGNDINITDSKFINNGANTIVVEKSDLYILNSEFINNKEYIIDLNNSEVLIENSIFDNDVGASIRVLDDSQLYLSKNVLSSEEYILNKGIILSETKIIVLNNLTLNCNVGEKITLNATIYDDNGNIIIVDDLDFIVGTETIDSILENTTYTADYITKIGTHIASAFVDSNLKKYTVDYGLIIAKYNSSVEITQLDNITYGEKLNINYNFENTTNVLIEITDEKGNIIYNNTTNQKTITIDNLKANKYNITITTQESENYTSTNTTQTFQVYKANTSITINNITNITYGEKLTIKFTSENVTTINVVIKDENGRIIFNKDLNESYVEISDLIRGNYTVTATFKGDSNYNGCNDTGTFAVNGLTPEINVNQTEIKSGDYIVINVKNDDLTNNLTVKIGNMTYTVPIIDNTAIIPTNNIPIGNYSVVISYPGDEKYNPYIDDLEISIYKKLIDNYTIEITANDIYAGENATISVTLPVDVTRNVTIIVNNKNYIVKINNGTATKVISDLPIGQYNVSVYYEGDDKYSSKTNSTTFKVMDKPLNNYTLEIRADDILAGDEALIFIILPEDAKGYVIITVDGKKYNKTLNEGIALLRIQDLKTGKYEVEVSYSGDEKYIAKSNSTSFNVLRNIIVEAPELIKYYSADDKFIVSVFEGDKPLANKNVTININGVEYVRTTNDEGIASLTVNLNSGNYTTIVKVDNITVESLIIILSTLNGKDMIKVYRNDTQYYAAFTDRNGNPLVNTTVSFNINGVFYNRITNENGTAKLNINLPPGEYILTAINTATGEMKSNVIKVIPVIESYDLTKYFRNDSQFIVRIHTADGGYVGAGEKVQFNINGVFYTRTTNATGHAKLNINLPQGNYTITTYYKDCSQGNEITVLPVLSADDLVMKYRDGSQFKAKLVDNQGNPYPNKPVTFNINGVFYNKLTDNQGIAKLNINLMSGEYLITSSYNGCNIANKITIRG